MSDKIKVGLFGLGHLGRIHLKCILASDKFELIGAFDPNPEAIALAKKNFDFKVFDNEEDLIDSCEMIDIVVPTSYHYDVATKCLNKNKHLFIEKPLTNTVEEGRKLMELSIKKEKLVQVGHVERFNPSYLALKELNFKPIFIEGHRLAMFNPRGTDVSVVYDLMIHDLDMVLRLVQSEVESVQASGVSIISKQPDICNARIQFKNGAVANLTASRISMKNMRKLRLFQNDAYISMDFLEKTSEIIQLKNPEELSEEEKDKMLKLEIPSGDKYITIQIPEIEPVNAIQMELESLADSIHQNTEPVVSISDGLKALELAEMITAEMKISAEKYSLN